MDKSTKEAAVTGLVILILFLVGFAFFGPILTIVSLNTVFRLDIPVNVWTYLSVFWLQIVLTYRYQSSKS